MGAARFGSTFYARMGLAMLLFIVLGFGPFILHRLENGPAASPVLHLHAAAFVLWVCVFTLQAHLMGAGNRALHIRLGTLSPVLAGVMVISAVFVTIESYEHFVEMPGMFTREHFIILPLMDGLLFPVYYTLAFLKRQKAETHKRLMLLSAVMIMDPAVGRLGFTLGSPVYGIILHFGLLAALLIHDRRTLGRVHPVTAVAYILLVLRYAAFFLLAPTEGWVGFVHWLFG